MKLKFILGYVLALALITACRKDQWNDCFQSTGKDITVTHSLNAFSKLRIGEKFEVTLIQDTAQPEQIKITSGSHIIGQIVAKVRDGTLTVENKNTCNFVRSYNRKISLEIRVRYLDDIELFAASNLSAPETLHFDNKSMKLKNFGLGDIHLKLNVGFLDVNCIASGDINLDGFANILSCSIEEATQFDARKLVCDDIYVDCHTKLDCFVNARKKLYAKIFHTGNVYYVSTPTGDLKLVEKRGSGDLLLLK